MLTQNNIIKATKGRHNRIRNIVHSQNRIQLCKNEKSHYFSFFLLLSTLHRLIETKTSKDIAEKTETVSRLCKTSFFSSDYPRKIRWDSEKNREATFTFLEPFVVSRVFIDTEKFLLFSVSLFYFYFGGVAEWCNCLVKKAKLLHF